jgi:uncharacterized protein
MSSAPPNTLAPPNLIVPFGTQIVLVSDLCPPDSALPQCKGSVAEIIEVPTDAKQAYGIRFANSLQATVNRGQFSILKQVKTGPIGDLTEASNADSLRRFVIYQCVVGSQAYGLSREGSDIDRRGVYLPPADLDWSLYGLPEQLEFRETEECYWEFKKFLILGLKANPNVLECLYTPIVEKSSEIGDALRARREIFLSKLVYQTYNGYVMSQFKRLEQDLRSQGEIKWKHAMHLIRLLLQGITILRSADLPVHVSEHRDSLLAIRDGREAWSSINEWRLSLHREFDEALRSTTLPDAPNYAEVDRLLLWARRSMVEVKS